MGTDARPPRPSGTEPPRRPAAGWLGLLPVALLLACGGEAPAPATREEGPAAETVQPAPAPAGPALFVDRAGELGLDFFHFNGMSGELFLDEITCAGGALGDFDGDGDLDALLSQGTMLGPGKMLADARVPPRHQPPWAPRLYRNDLAGPGAEPHFTDVTTASGLAELAPVYGCGIATGDFDNDGDLDVYRLNLGPNQLLANRGDGTFEDVTAAAGAQDDRSSVVGVFFDYDRDGWLDLFVGNNVTFDHSGATVCRSLTGAVDYCGPGAFPFEADRLLHNRGDGTFEDVTRAAGLAAAPSRPTLGAVAADFNGDGRSDLYVANDGEPNNLWIQRPDGTFADQALLAGAGVNAAGAAEASMGIDAGDVDADGDPDVFLAHLIKETNTLYVNDGRGLFTDATAATGLGPPSLPFTSFGSSFVDFDNDGWLDLLVVNGAVTLLPELVRQGDPYPLHQTNQLFRNLGPGADGVARFEEVTARAGEVFRLSEVSRGAAFGDVDNDGDTDVLVINNNGPARLLVNQVGQDRPWIGLRLVGGDPPRDRLGARVALLRGGVPVEWRRVHTDGSFASASDPRVIFGLGDTPGFDTDSYAVRVVWPSGRVEEFSGLATGEYTTLVEGKGATSSGTTAASGDRLMSEKPD